MAGSDEHQLDPFQLQQVIQIRTRNTPLLFPGDAARRSPPRFEMRNVQNTDFERVGRPRPLRLGDCEENRERTDQSGTSETVL
jgi:hypothetical protein